MKRNFMSMAFAVMCCAGGVDMMATTLQEAIVNSEQAETASLGTVNGDHFSSFEEMVEIIDAKSKVYYTCFVTLEADVTATIDKPWTFSTQCNLDVDLNNHTLSLKYDGAALVVKKGSNLLIYNGKLVNTSTNAKASVLKNSGKVNIGGVTLVSTANAATVSNSGELYIDIYEKTQRKSVLSNTVGSTFLQQYALIEKDGYSYMSVGDIDNCKLKNATLDHATVEVSGGDLTIRENVTAENTKGMVLKASSDKAFAAIYDGTYKAVGLAVMCDEDATIYVYDGEYDVKKNDKGLARVFYNRGDKGELLVHGGRFKPATPLHENDKTTTIDGGYFVTKDIRVDKDCVVRANKGQYNDTYPYRVANAEEAMIGKKRYATLKEAIAAAVASEKSVTITLVDDVVTDEPLTINTVNKEARITLDLAANNINVRTADGKVGFVVTEDTRVTIKNNGFGRVWHYVDDCQLVSNRGYLTIDNVSMYSTSDNVATVVSSGALAIKGEESSIYNYGKGYALRVRNGSAELKKVSLSSEKGSALLNEGKVVIYGGTLRGNEKLAAIVTEKNGDTRIEGGYVGADNLCIVNKGKTVINGGSFHSGEIWYDDESIAMINYSQTPIVVNGGEWTAGTIADMSDASSKLYDICGGIFSNNKFLPADDHKIVANTDPESAYNFPYLVVSDTSSSQRVIARKPQTKVVKTIENGRVVIVKGDERYDISGRKI